MGQDFIGGAERDRTRYESVRYDRVDSDSIPTVGLSIRPLSLGVVEWKTYNTPFAFSSNLPSTDLKYISLKAASDRVAYSSL